MTLLGGVGARRVENARRIDRDVRESSASLGSGGSGREGGGGGFASVLRAMQARSIVERKIKIENKKIKKKSWIEPNSGGVGADDPQNVELLATPGSVREKEMDGQRERERSEDI